jgi:hypothetical protein
LVDETGLRQSTASTAKWRLVLLVDEIEYGKMQQSTAKWRLVLLVDETGLRHSVTNHRHLFW